jgi:hypothetical protein
MKNGSDRESNPGPQRWQALDLPTVTLWPPQTGYWIVCRGWFWTVRIVQVPNGEQDRQINVSVYPRQRMSNSRRLLSRFSPDTAEDTAPNQCDRCLTCRQPITGVVYPHVLNTSRQRRAARQLLFVVDNARAVTSNLASKYNTLS